MEKKVFVYTDFFMSEDELPQITTKVFEKEEDAKKLFKATCEEILAIVEKEFDSHSEEDYEADAVFKKTDTFCEAYKDSACLDWWWWVKIEEKEVF